MRKGASLKPKSLDGIDAVSPVAELFRIHGRGRAVRQFKSLLALIEESAGVRALSREELLAKQMRVEGFRQNFRSMLSAIDRVEDEYLRGEIANGVAQLLETTFVVGFYGPKNHLDEENAARARKNQSAPATKAKTGKSEASQVIVERHAAEFRARPGKSKQTCRSIARAIRAEVNIELQHAKLPVLGDDAIRKRIEKMG